MSQGTPPTPPQASIPIASQPFPGSLTPGWNDPPPICSQQSVSSTTRTKLNKRVPFPLQQGQQGLPSTTKPTAIVQPCQTTTTTTTGATGISGNIAVVHPLQYPNQMMPPPLTTFPNISLPLSANVNASNNQSPQFSVSPSTQTSCASGASGNVPTMSVPAVPRQNNANENVIGAAAFSTSSQIQHI